MMSERFVDAVEFANELHGDQIRKGTKVPYISHLLIVSGIVLQHGGGEDEAIAALLHDTVEDCGGKPVMVRIRECFGDKIAGLVDGCSETDIQPKPPWLERKEGYIESIRSADPSVRLISCADKIHNASSIISEYRKVGEQVWDRFKANKTETLWFYTSIINAMRASGENRPILDELVIVVEELKKLVEG
jgi:(p)ppGpp synthase/HD superfamily hydrolase